MAQEKRLMDVAAAEWEAERGKRHELAVPEWKCTVYWSAWTMADYDAVFGPGAPRSTYGQVCRAIVQKLHNADGKALFVLPEEDELLRKARPEICTRLGEAIIATLPDAKEQAGAAKK